MLVSKLVLWAQSTTEDYIRAECWGGAGPQTTTSSLKQFKRTLVILKLDQTNPRPNFSSRTPKCFTLYQAIIGGALSRSFNKEDLSQAFCTFFSQFLPETCCGLELDGKEIQPTVPSGSSKAIAARLAIQTSVLTAAGKLVWRIRSVDKGFSSACCIALV